MSELLTFAPAFIAVLFVIGNGLYRHHRSNQSSSIRDGFPDELLTSEAHRARLLAPFTELGASIEDDRFSVPDEPGLDVFVATHEVTQSTPSSRSQTWLWFVAVFYFELDALPDGVSLSTHLPGTEYVPERLGNVPPVAPRPTQLHIHDANAPGEQMIVSRLAAGLELILDRASGMSASQCAGLYVEDASSAFEELHRREDQLVLVYRGCQVSAMPAIFKHARALRRGLCGWTDGERVAERAARVMAEASSLEARKLCAKIALSQQQLANRSDDRALLDIVEDQIAANQPAMSLAEFAPMMSDRFVAGLETNQLLEILQDRPTRRIADALGQRVGHATLFHDTTQSVELRVNLFASLVVEPGSIECVLEMLMDRDLGAVLSWLVERSVEPVWLAFTRVERFGERLAGLDDVSHAMIDERVLTVEHRSEDALTQKRRLYVLMTYARASRARSIAEFPPALRVRILAYRASTEAQPIDWRGQQDAIEPGHLGRLIEACSRNVAPNQAFLGVILGVPALSARLRAEEQLMVSALELLSRVLTSGYPRREVIAERLALFSALANPGSCVHKSRPAQEQLEATTETVVMFVEQANARADAIHTFGALVHAWGESKSSWQPAELRDVYAMWRESMGGEHIRGALTHVEHGDRRGGLTSAGGQEGGLSMWDDA